MKRACMASASARTSAGRSRGSWMVRAAASTIISLAQLRRPPSMIMRARRGSTGNAAMARPMAVRVALLPRPLRGARGRSVSAPSSRSRFTPSLMARDAGGCTNGKREMSPGSRTTPIAIICRMTAARLVRRISGSVNSGRELKSSSE